MSYNPENSDRSVDGLVLEGLNLNDKKRVVATTAKPSLLSSALARERVHHLPQHHAYHPVVSAAEAYHEHPEPELLASSVGKELDGRLIPSSSTISLLSLSNNHHQVSPQTTHPAQFVPQPSHDDQHYAYHSPKAVHDRKSGLRSRNSVTHLAHKRLENYQRLASPAPQQQHPLDHATSQSIPITVKYVTPDSPNLDPTSLNGSPSRFWLSSQTPPMSLSNSYKKTSLINLQQLQNNTQVRKHPAAQPVFIPMKRGSDSPILLPVQTASEDAPMTPLYLSNDPNANYFNLDANIDEEKEEEELQTDEMNIEV